MKLYSKLIPGVTAETIGAQDDAGRYPAYVYGLPDAPGRIAASIAQDEWSEVETVPVPESIPDVVYAALYGRDPVAWKMTVFATEREAKVFTEGEAYAWGYVPLGVARNLMVPASKPSVD